MQNQFIFSQSRFLNHVIDKKQFTQLIIWAFSKYGTARAANMADQLKDLGFYYATKAGISLSIEDLRIPPIKKRLLNRTFKSIKNADIQYTRGEITAVERFQKVIDIWHNTNETLKQEVIKYFKETDPLNSIYMMSFSGARGNISQVRQLVGMRGLMADPHGQIIDLPIVSNFREGLTVTEYFISSYGARKGLVDTALRTADSGYLTRRLVDVAQDVIIRQADCKTTRGILLEDVIDNPTLMSLEQALLGRVLAENIYDPYSGELIAHAKKDISSELADKIIKAGIKKVLVRSPITCESTSAVCQRCYGWNLSHRKLVDIGEAVGIIAAQSIGEPGTQLTMRTFHTGGVFTGEVAQKICSPVNGIIKYPNDINYTDIRTKHGDLAFLIQKDCTLSIESREQKATVICLRKGTSLLIKHNSVVRQQQIIAEEPLSKQLMTEEAEKQVVTDLSGKVRFANLTIQETSNNQRIARLTKQEGLVWILSGQVYNIPDNAKIIVKKYSVIRKNTSLARLKITNKHAGRVKILNLNNESIKISSQVQIITDEVMLPNSKVYLGEREFQGSHILETDQGEKFILQVTPGEKVTSEQIIADLVSDTYKTSTGGIIKYLDLSVTRKKNKLLENSYEILGSGYILWIPEETHEINKDSSALLVQHGDIIEAGTEIIKNTFSKNSGVVEIIKKEDVVKEIVIKPGVLYHCINLSSVNMQYREFLRPGERIIKDFYTDKLVYCEYIKNSSSIYKLVRPVTVYSIPRKHYSCELNKQNQPSNNLYIKIVKKTGFRDGERIKSVNGIDLVTTHIVVYIKNKHPNLQTILECTRSHLLNNQLQIKLITAEILSIKKYCPENMYQITKLSVKQNETVLANTVIAQTEILSKAAGQIEDIIDQNNFRRRILVLTDTNQHIINVKNTDKVLVKHYQWIYVGDKICSNIYSKHSGQIIKIDKNAVIIRIARPYLLSNAADLHVNNNDLVQQGEKIATLKFQRSKTKDIIQGLPKIEEILEARKKSDTSFKPHEVLNNCFKNYLRAGLGIKDSTRLSLQKIQLHLVKEIQLVYQSQKVDISDKHIEVIIKQMTSKVKIEKGGDTGYLPGEIMTLEKIEKTNLIVSKMNKQTATYYPILMGITKASLNTESFISAASFQETTKVLTEAAISGKLDWLKGLKENVIIGRLIPAGTGFDTYNNFKHTILKDPETSLSDNYIVTPNKPNNLTQDLDDIILDDRTAHSYDISD